MTEELELLDGALHYLNLLSKNHELYLITARSTFYSPNLIELTRAFIKKNNIKFNGVFFNLYKENKAKKCLELGINLFIDDDINNCKAVNDKGIDVIHFAGSEYVSKRNWKEVYEYIEGENDGRQSY